MSREGWRIYRDKFGQEECLKDCGQTQIDIGLCNPTPTTFFGFAVMADLSDRCTDAQRVCSACVYSPQRKR